ncbi:MULTISPECIES: D-alanyl-D-alanine carboxypeptidase family protein [Pseudomonas]|uniref:serine-type D-Ala-D-Ala carboxypeptidase n=1 Tax=Pseudomonas neustonica TaxID=2487346 RepID=A0ABX9XMM5_9PSED|nr:MULTISPECIES: D-alanyl-D-alanine carboxypeptidase family protein [Pseudomonas]MBA6419647.1 D-alanyl-D-alanine carboxypeptidase [Pseudomonas sp. 5Ae-yellow]ROZ87123.1 D-alanyl-D-alanine carboxypeptidase [Pseudomonas sp. SSM44]ROZ88261.1 D-alanyl-D-alanine carboxypeptidase [Pseudomonas neustonica]|tara:strand:- start:10361 stop:11566 length:1206 start_codon:yes stop_codon:yes gene_type:complete
MLKNLISTLLVTGATLLSVSALAQTPTLNSAPTLDSQSAAPIVPAAPELAASSYLLIDANSGAVLVEHNADEALPPASLTKMMTSYIGSQEIKRGQIGQNDLVLVSEKAWRMGGSKMFIKVGNQVPVIDLMRGIIIQSGNDASIALAEHIAGSEDAFADMMNGQAKRLGMTNSHFVNATGWPAEGHYSSARDLAILARAIIDDDPEEHYKIYGEKEFVWNEIRQPNRNLMLWRDSTVDGLKTGHTEEAGYCLVASAKREDMRLISVVMGTTSEQARAAETQKLLTWGFRFFETKTFYQPGQVISTARVWKGQQEQVDLGLQNGLQLTLPKGQLDRLEAGVTMQTPIQAPIKAGDVLGQVEVKLGDEIVHSAPLVALSDVAEAGFVGRLWDSVRLFFYGLFN